MSISKCGVVQRTMARANMAAAFVGPIRADPLLSDEVRSGIQRQPAENRLSRLRSNSGFAGIGAG